MMPRPPTAWNPEVIPCLIVVDSAALSDLNFRNTLSSLRARMQDPENSKLRIGMVTVASTIDPPHPDNIRFLIPHDWHPNTNVVQEHQGSAQQLPKAILYGLWAIRRFVHESRADGVRVLPPLVYVFTRSLPDDDPETTGAIATYTKKAISQRRLVMKWFYMPEHDDISSAQLLEQFVSNLDDIQILRNNDLPSNDVIRSQIVQIVSHSISSFIESLSLPHLPHPPSEITGEDEELADMMKQDKFRP